MTCGSRPRKGTAQCLPNTCHRSICQVPRPTCPCTPARSSTRHHRHCGSASMSQSVIECPPLAASSHVSLFSLFRLRLPLLGVLVVLRLVLGVGGVWGGVEGGISRFSLTQSIRARENSCITALGSDNSCAYTGHERAPSKVRLSSTIGTGSTALTEDMSPAPAAGTCSRSLCMTSDRSLGTVWHEVLGQVQVQVPVQVVGLVWLVGSGPRCLLPVFTFVATSGCTDCPLRTQFTLVAEQVTAHFVDPRFAARAELHSSGRYLPVPGSGRKRRYPLASKPFVCLLRQDILCNFLSSDVHTAHSHPQAASRSAL